MNILIVEDESRIAKRLERMISNILSNEIENITVLETLSEAQEFIKGNAIDLLFLDLNLSGEDGFRLLKSVIAESFQTIVVSAYKDRAIEAFEYGVLDFIAKPFNEERLMQACQRLTEVIQSDPSAKFLSISKKNVKELINVEEVNYIQGAGVYTEVITRDGIKYLHNKSLDSLLRILPRHFCRVHKSYIANMKQVTSYRQEPGSKYYLILNNVEIPIGRTKFQDLKSQWFS